MSSSRVLLVVWLAMGVACTDSMSTTQVDPTGPYDLAAFDEILITPGDTITLHGMIEISRDDAAAGERGYRDDAPAVARLVPPHDAQVRVLRIF